MLSEVLTSMPLGRVVRFVFIFLEITFQPLNLCWHFPYGSFRLFVVCLLASFVWDVLWYVWKCMLTLVSYCRCWVWTYWESYLFCVVVFVVVSVESEILLSLVTAPHKTRANSGITINSKFSNLQYDTLHTNELPTCMTDKQRERTQEKYQ
jgi:hypothetical protein